MRTIIIDDTDLLQAIRLIFQEELRLSSEAKKLKTYSIKEAAKALSVSVSTLYRMRDQGEIETTRVRGKKVFTEEAIQRVLNKPR